MSNEKLIFTSIIFPGKESETRGLLLVNSIRTFAGSLSQLPIWFYVPKVKNQVSLNTQEKFSQLNVRLSRFEITDDVLSFPFAPDVTASAIAETEAAGKTGLLAWLGANTIILKEPRHFLLPDDKYLGYRPVHHCNIGSLYNDPADQFWASVYHHCKVPDDRIFPMTTHVDGELIRPYFNAGILITRLEDQLLAKWRDSFLSVYQNPDLLEFYKKDKRYAVFIHQAILSGVILASFSKDTIQELPSNYNYPIHLFTEDVTENRPGKLEELVSVRYEGFQDLSFSNGLLAEGEIVNWIKSQLL